MNDETLTILKKVGAIITDSHIVYTSGRHGDAYINKDALYPHTKETARVGELFAEKFKDKDVDVVAAPALGGIILETWTAYYLSKLKNKEVLGVYAEKKDGDLVFTRGYDKLLKDKNVLVIEDLTTTGGSVKKVVDSVRNAGGNVVAVCVMVNRDVEKVTEEVIGAPFSSLASVNMKSYDPTDCELCKNNVPVNTDVGHGKKFLEAQKA